jgi:hypothetical protein
MAKTEKAPERYVYKSLRPRTIGMIPARSRMITDGAGNTRWSAPAKGIKVTFSNGVFEINESTAAIYKKPNGKSYTPKELKKVFEEYPHYGSVYRKVFDSSEKTTEEQVAFSKKADAINRERGTKTTQGVRAQKN